jgi:hypothetical protein
VEPAAAAIVASPRSRRRPSGRCGVRPARAVIGFRGAAAIDPGRSWRRRFSPAPLSRPEVQLKAYAAIQGAARQHWGSVRHRGHTQLLIGASTDLNEISSSLRRDAAVSGRGVVSCDRPSAGPCSRAAFAYLPEQIAGYLLAILVPSVRSGFDAMRPSPACSPVMRW